LLGREKYRRKLMSRPKLTKSCSVHMRRRWGEEEERRGEVG
jgi:hypothetical protein